MTPDGEPVSSSLKKKNELDTGKNKERKREKLEDRSNTERKYAVETDRCACSLAPQAVQSHKCVCMILAV